MKENDEKIKLVFVLPTKNEQTTLEPIFHSIKSVCEQHHFTLTKVIITDDSHDKTRKIAKNLGIDIVIGGSKGLGHAMLVGLKASMRYEADFIFTIDADGQVDLNEIPKFIKYAQSEDVDLVLGSRFLEDNLIEYKYRFINRTGVRILAGIMNYITGLELTDSHGGIRCYRPEVIDKLHLIGSHTYVQETIISAHENGFSVKEFPSRWLKRESGSSRVVGSIPKYISYTLPVLLLRAGLHIKILYPLGLLLILSSFIHVISVGIIENFNIEELFNRQTFHMTMLLFTTGLNLFFFGFIFEILMKINRGNHK